eukprot:9184099-Pyramimonas_sp.AAC.1
MCAHTAERRRLQQSPHADEIAPGRVSRRAHLLFQLFQRQRYATVVVLHKHPRLRAPAPNHAFGHIWSHPSGRFRAGAALPFREERRRSGSLPHGL